MRIRINKDERGLLFKHGNYVKVLLPGKYRFFSKTRYQIIRMDVTKPFAVEGKEINLFLHDTNLATELIVINVTDHELALHYEDGRLAGVYPAGKYGFWDILKQHTFTIIDTRQPEIGAELVPVINHPQLSGLVIRYEVAPHEQGILYFNHQFQRLLEPGVYYFWSGPFQITVAKLDLRRQQVEINGQEMMTADKVVLRLNFACQYRIVDPLQIMQIKDYSTQLYLRLQLLLREYVGSLTLDELLTKKEEVGRFVLERLQRTASEYGVEFCYAGVKDVILPGEVRSILNTVLLAEKQAQANLITRREEVASTRSLLNTAKMMEENQMLCRLKELEFLEKICEKIGSISVNGGNLLEQLGSLLAVKGMEKIK